MNNTTPAAGAPDREPADASDAPTERIPSAEEAPTERIPSFENAPTERIRSHEEAGHTAVIPSARGGSDHGAGGAGGARRESDALAGNDEPTVVHATIDAHPYPEAAYAPVDRSGEQPLSAQEQFPLYVQAPVAPGKRGNRGFGMTVGLIGTLIFGGAYAAASSGILMLSGSKGGFLAILMGLIGEWTFILPVVVFFLAWVVSSTFINRGGWVHWVLGGFLIGLFTALGWFGGFAIEEQIWTLTLAAAAEKTAGVAFSFGPVVAFIIAREIPVWLGGWIAAHGRKIRAANLEAQAEYEQTLEAGPTGTR